jgi:uncharacterized protein
MPASDTSSTRETVGEFMRRFGAGDLDGVAELFAELVDLRIPGADHVPWTGCRSTHAELVEFFTIWAGALKAPNLAVSQVLFDGADAVVLGNITSTVKATGRPFDTPFALHLTVKDGRLTRYHLYDDSHAAAAAFNLSSSGLVESQGAST